ncbi:MAG TPA: hypothetical protein VG916_15340 [Gemmatimonadaceae bacterium]|nr:hypothetical protein [Gemmatimonadaceae bacterium]
MRLLWTLTKVVLALAIGIPLAIIALSMALGVLGALVGLAFFALRIAIIGLLVYAGVRLAMRLFGGGDTPAPRKPPELSPPVDPYLEMAKRELDRDLGTR